MSIFSEKKAKPVVSESQQEIADLAKTLSPNQLRVAKERYKMIMFDLAQHMDIDGCSTELKKIVSLGVMNRLITYQMTKH